MSRTLRLIFSAALLASSASPLIAQTLADVAKMEEDRRRTVKASGRTITNRDLQSVPPPSAFSGPAGDQVVAPAGSLSGAAAPGGPAGSATGDKKAADAAKDRDQGAAKDQKAWRDRMTQMRTQLDRDKTFAEALQTRINALTTDFVNRDDPAQRSAISADRQKSIDELSRVKKAVVDGTKAIVDLEEEARRAGVPAGWLR
jgi:hypothetical protein